MMNRIKTGISGLDERIDGIPSGKTILLTGEPGTGKTIFGLQFACNACRQGVKTMYVITEETVEDLRTQASSVGLDIEGSIEDGMLEFVDSFGPRTALIEDAMKLEVKAKRNFLEILHEIPKDMSGKLLVIDNLGAFTNNLGLTEFKERLDILIHYLSRRAITTLLILDSATSSAFNDVSFYAVYGALRLLKKENPYTGVRERCLDIVKMRNTKIPLQPLTYEINSGGIEILA
jgi:KaiC/GvpD/RAD55 family RecA-like ATPase